MTIKKACVAVDNYPQKVELFREALNDKDWISEVAEGPGLNDKMHNFYVKLDIEDIGKLAKLCRRLTIKSRGILN